MSVKRIFIDTETTGRDPERNAIVQLAAIVDIDSEIVDARSWTMKPHEGAEIEDAALEVTNMTRDQIAGFADQRGVFREFVRMLDDHIDKFSKTDKTSFVAYNARFDVDFVRAWFLRNNHSYFGSYFWTVPADPMQLMGWFVGNGSCCVPTNFKLNTIADIWGVELGLSAHDAMADIVATRELYYRMDAILQDTMVGRFPEIIAKYPRYDVESAVTALIAAKMIQGVKIG